MVGQAVAELEGIDVLINNAGIQISAPGATSSQARTLTRSSPSTFAALCAREAIRHFLAEQKPGVIVNVSSATR